MTGVEPIMNGTRKAVIGLILAAFVALPGGVFAASTNGVINESGTAAVSVSATIPTSASYTLTGNTFSATIAVTAVSSTFSGGLHMTASPNSGGSNQFDPAKRTIVATGPSWTPVAAAGTMGYWSTSGGKAIADKASDASGDAVSLASTVQISAAGSYTGTLTISVTTTN
jgi:hypothetical protein